ncbi:MAG: T9SS type A sorting domain-containing protein [Ignavibacteriales bacterium]
MKTLTLALIIIISSLSFSQGNQWVIYNSVNSRLPNNTVYAIAIDKQGVKWIGTGMGLACFDGTTWKIFRKANSGLPHDVVRAIAIDEQGNKWIGTNGGGLAKFDGTNWTVYNKSNSGLTDSTVRAIVIDKQGNKWIGTYNKGLFKYDGTSWIVYDNSTSSLPINCVLSLAIDQLGNKWVGTNGGGVAKFDGTKWTIYNKLNSGTHCNTFLSIVIDSKNIKWFGTYNAALEKFDDNDWFYYDSTHTTIRDRWVHAVAIDRQDVKWAGTNGHCLARYDNKIWTAYDTATSAIPDTCVLAIAVDQQNNKWIGTNIGGLAVLNENGINIKSIIVTLPAGGTVWTCGSRQNINWNSSNVSGNVNIKLSLNGGNTFPILLASDTPNDGIESVILPDEQAQDCRILIESSLDATVQGINPGNFSIVKLKTPALITPANGDAVGLVSLLTLQWSKIADAANYKFQLSTDSDFKNIVISDSTLHDTLKTITTLSKNTKYFWRVCAKNPGSTGQWSETWNFSTTMPLPEITNLISPADNSSNVPERIRFIWHRSRNAVTYRLTVSENSEFSRVFFSDSIINDSSKEVIGLKHGEKYYWRVIGENASGVAPGSATWSFMTQLYYPDSLEAISMGPKKIKLTWRDNSNNELGFIVERKYDSDFYTIDTAMANSTSFVDSVFSVLGNYVYRIKAFTAEVQSVYSNTASVVVTHLRNKTPLPEVFILNQNYPNPFNPSTKIKYSVPKESFVSLRVYDLLGNEIMTLVSSKHSPGNYEIIFDGSNLPSGVYMYCMDAGQYKMTKKLVLLK